jgi:type I restriction enzyme S subunit
VELRIGYKNTDLGVIPDDWHIKTLGDIGDSLIGLTYHPSQVRNYGTLVLRSSNIQDGSLCFDNNVFVEAPIPERIMVRDGDILVCARNGSRDLIGKSALINNQAKGATFGAFMAIFRSKYGQYLHYIFQSYIFKKQINQHLGATINQITNKSLSSFRVPLPSSDKERKKIINTLSDIDSLLTTLEKIIAKKRDMKQSVMQQLLTGNSRLSGFSGEWKIKLLGDISYIKTGKRNNEDKVEDGLYPFYVRSSFVEKINTYSYDCEAILVPGEGQIGNIFHYINGRFDAHQRVYVITQFAESVFARYIYLFMSQHFGFWAMQNTVKATVDSLRLPTFKTFEVRVPPTIEEQIAIANSIGDMHAELSLFEIRRNKTRDLKQAIMQELLTGKTRLINKEPSNV